MIRKKVSSSFVALQELCATRSSKGPQPEKFFSDQKMLRRTILLAALGLFIGACAPEAPQPFNATDITGATFGKGLVLSDTAGERRTLDDYKGRAVVLFFGYTHCPDVCPAALAKFAEVLKAMGDDGSKVQVLFVTLDPERDTAEKLAQYVPFFHPSFIGLTGSREEVDAVAREYRVFYARQPPAGGSEYSLDHWAGAYAVDPAGRLRLYLAPELGIDEMAGDMARLARGE
jgi:protein SCO1/2